MAVAAHCGDATVVKSKIKVTVWTVDWDIKKWPLW